MRWVAYSIIFLAIFYSPSCFAQTGSIYITSKPSGANISLDDNPFYKKTDMLIEHIPIGTHKIMVEHLEYGKVEQTIEIKEGLTTTLHFDLQPKGKKDTAICQGRGFTYLAKNQYDLAIADFTKAIELDPNGLIAYYNRGVAYLDMGSYDLAIADFTEVIELDPKDATIYNDRGMIYLLKGQYKQTIADLTKAMELDPKNAGLYYLHLGFVSDKIGDKEMARHNFFRAREKDKNAIKKSAEFLEKKISPEMKKFYAEEILSASQYIGVQPYMVYKAKEIVGEISLQKPSPAFPLQRREQTSSFIKAYLPKPLLIIGIGLIGIILTVLMIRFTRKRIASRVKE